MNIQSLIGIFTVSQGEIKILLERKKDNPYKSYWTLPSRNLGKEDLNENINNIIDNIGLNDIYLNQVHTYSKIEIENNMISIAYIGLIDSVTFSLKNISDDYEWFNISSLPKIAYNYYFIINDLYEFFKKKIVNSNILKILFPSDFTLPELQKVYEQVLNTNLDRRNFRKKLINLGYIIDTGEINDGFTGRPAKLYRFNENFKERNLF